MPDLDDLLTEWRTKPQTFITVSDIRLDKALQPRNIRLAPMKDHARIEASSREHVAGMAGLLAAHPTAELEPVLVARIGKRLLLVDGHHRLRGYRQAGRLLIPAKVITIDMDSAVHVSKLVNLDGAKLAMHKAQRLEATWQYLARVTHGGSLGTKGDSLELPKGTSRRTIGARFNIAKSTVQDMTKRMLTLNRADYGPEACDPGTEWPNWKYVCGNATRDRFAEVDADTRTQRDAMSVAKTLARLVDKYPSEVIRLGVLALERDTALHIESGTFDALPDLAAEDESPEGCPELSD